MKVLFVERLGGLAGFGGPGARIRSRGQLDMSSLADRDRQAIEKLFDHPDSLDSTHVRDGFRYRLSRGPGRDSETVEVPESAVPAVISSCVKDELS